jgi:hypothetical protein
MDIPTIYRNPDSGKSHCQVVLISSYPVVVPPPQQVRAWEKGRRSMQKDATKEAIRALRALILSGERYRQVLSDYVGLGVTDTQASATSPSTGTGVRTSSPQIWD